MSEHFPDFLEFCKCAKIYDCSIYFFVISTYKTLEEFLSFKVLT